MRDILQEKFGLIVATTSQLLEFLHAPQLFLSILYHTNTRCKDCEQFMEPLLRSFAQLQKEISNVNNSQTIKVIEIFSADESFESVFGSDACIQLTFPGEIGKIDRVAETYFTSNIYEDAVNAFSLRFFSQSLLCNVNQSSVQRVYYLSEIVYKIALSQYELRKYELAVRMIKSHMSNAIVNSTLQISALAGRMMTLLMCSEYKQGNTDKVKIFVEYIPQ
jgi:hypothetical protein